MPQITFHYSLHSAKCWLFMWYPRQGISVSCWTPCVNRSPCAQSGRAFSGWFPRLRDRVLLAFFDVRTHFLLRVPLKTTPAPRPTLHSFLCNIIKHPTSNCYSGASEVNCTSYTLCYKSILQSPVKSLRVGGHSTFPDISRSPLDGLRKLVSAFSLISLSNVVLEYCKIFYALQNPVGSLG